MNSKGWTYQGSQVLKWLFVLIVASLTVLSVRLLLRNVSKKNDAIIQKDISHIQSIFHKIHQDCFISSFAHIKNNIDFLTVHSFVGSQVGSMTLGFPRNWKGPYVNVNPAMNGTTYVVLKNKQGYFIVPGDGVCLYNGSVIGKDIVLDYDTDMYALMKDPQGLWSTSGALAAALQIGSNSVARLMQYPELLQPVD